MRLVIQIPCYNEEHTLPDTLAGIPRSIPGIDSIETLIVDDGSTDRTIEVAKKNGVHEVVRHTGNLGLAFAFRTGIDAALARGADIIVNMDGDNQYPGSEIEKLIAPILKGEADIVVGDRGTNNIEEFSAVKKFLQWLGSAVVRKLSSTTVRDAASGFRAFSREAALRLTILSNFTYTHEVILQARAKGLVIRDVRIRTNKSTRNSRLMSSIRTYIIFSMATIIRVFTMYNPLRLFIEAGVLSILVGGALAGRFAYFFFFANSQGKIQSLIFAAVFLLAGVMLILIGLVADIIQFNRRLLEDALARIKRLELESRDRR